MTHDLSYYKKIQGLHGTASAKEAEIRRIKTDFEQEFDTWLDTEVVTVNGTSSKLIITKTQDDMVKKVSAPPSGAIYLGDIVYWLSTYWIVDSMDADNRINTHGKMHRCNVTLKWLNEKGTTITRYGYCEDAAKSAEGVSTGNQLQVGESQYKIKVRKDAESIKLMRGKRFLFFPPTYAAALAASGGVPPAYELTKPNHITGDLNGSGYVELTLSESAFNQSTDNQYLMIADYYSKDDTYAITTTSTSPVSLTVGADLTLAATVTKNGVADQTAIWWYSSDETVATVSQTGKITAVSAGSCVITGKIAATEVTIAVNVKASQTGNAIQIYLPQGDTVITGETLRVEFNAFVNGVETSTTFSCAISGNDLPVATIQSTGSGYAIIKAADVEEYVGEEFTFTASSTALSVNASVTLRVGGWF
jgi:hypothetical protein